MKIFIATFKHFKGSIFISGSIFFDRIFMHELNTIPQATLYRGHLCKMVTSVRISFIAEIAPIAAHSLPSEEKLLSCLNTSCHFFFGSSIFAKNPMHFAAFNLINCSGKSKHLKNARLIFSCSS